MCPYDKNKASKILACSRAWTYIKVTAMTRTQQIVEQACLKPVDEKKELYKTTTCKQVFYGEDIKMVKVCMKWGGGEFKGGGLNLKFA